MRRHHVLGPFILLALATAGCSYDEPAPPAPASASAPTSAPSSPSTSSVPAEPAASVGGEYVAALSDGLKAAPEGPFTAKGASCFADALIRSAGPDLVVAAGVDELERAGRESDLATLGFTREHSNAAYDACADPIRAEVLEQAMATPQSQSQGQGELKAEGLEQCVDAALPPALVRDVVAGYVLVPTDPDATPDPSHAKATGQLFRCFWPDAE